MQRDTYRGVTTFILLMMLLSAFKLNAQHKCGFDGLAHELAAKSPMVAQKLYELRQPSIYRSAAKGTATEPYTIPLVFHFVLSQQQYNSIGGDAGIRTRLDSQLVVLNRDFNAANGDSLDIPDAFKPLYGNVNIRFALAHTAPDGSSTEGYDVKIVTQRGFEAEGGTSSGFGFSDAKYASTGGINAWDVESYLNVWVIAPLDGGAASNILGLAIPDYFADDYSMPAVEQGVVLNYRAVGKQVALTDVYIKGSEEGRTLTHEVGHYFELLHIWGDDDGKCPDNGGMDDGISDTPPQAYSSDKCSTYPKYDGCTRDGSGVMFMNYMDYSYDRCALMYTLEQAQRMQRTWQIGGAVYSLTQHPWLLDYPTGSNTQNSNTHTVYPNPADGFINILYKQPTTGLEQIMLVDVLGRIVYTQPVAYQAAFYTINTATMHAGLYFLVLHSGDDKRVERVLIR